MPPTVTLNWGINLPCLVSSLTPGSYLRAELMVLWLLLTHTHPAALRAWDSAPEALARRTVLQLRS